MSWLPKAQAKVTQTEAQQAKALLPPNTLWQLGVILEDGHIQFRGAMHPNASGSGTHPGVEVWTDIVADQYGAKPLVGYPTATPVEVEIVLQAIEKHGYPRDEAFTAIRIESGWKPNALNPVSHAVGLFQIMPAYLDDIGFSGTWQDFQKLSAAEQAPYADNYFAQSWIHNKWKYPGDTYLALAASGYVGKPDGVAIYKAGTKAYDQNKGWDINKDGVVTTDDIRGLLLSRMKGAPPPVDIPKAPKAPDADLSLSQQEWLSLLVMSLLEDAEKRRYCLLPPKTEAVIRRFQKANGLDVDGTPGRETLGKLLK